MYSFWNWNGKEEIKFNYLDEIKIGNEFNDIKMLPGFPGEPSVSRQSVAALIKSS